MNSVRRVPPVSDAAKAADGTDEMPG